ncbi:protein TOC75-3, chloroplastic [Amborella trichopoda]|uniref:Uncharacterized protein n=1 Tax=Amborella trichopoda TaxID=13333 RepID=W1PDG4_AMBTC|nr:protein TOC75-3, chloroplastic [Amborella trichopoda]ERN07972.1 hypothetical protein AMTR_s00012p00252410 [Amborella trichopoda]|eukprot:XP_006846297.1 protein TOC75-3, chloroplastic [Amborella trichopoda]
MAVFTVNSHVCTPSLPSLSLNPNPNPNRNRNPKATVSGLNPNPNLRATVCNGVSTSKVNLSSNNAFDPFKWAKQKSSTVSASNPNPNLRATVSNGVSTSKVNLSSNNAFDPFKWAKQKSSIIGKILGISAAAGLVCHIFACRLSSYGGNGGGGGGGNGGGGGDSGGFGRFWSELLSPVAVAKEEENQEWDPHGLPANILVQINKLSGFKKYKTSEILFFDKKRGSVVGTEDSFFEMVSLKPGGIYTKAHLQKELETLATCGMFEKVDLEAKTKPDGTIAVNISFAESTWQSADAFKCINVGLLPQSKPVDMDPDMTDREKFEYIKRQEAEYRKRMERSRPCLLPIRVQKEVLAMLREQGKVSARLLQKIRDRVQKWYHDEGYACAQVVNFGNLNTREVVCEVVEGDITQLVVQFQDKLGNVCEGNTELPIIRRELPKQLRQGHVFNIEAGKQALRNINSLALFSNIEVNPRPDEKNEGGIIVEIKLKELEQKTAEVSTEWSIVPGRQGRPTLASIQPGGTVSFEHRNIKGLNRSLLGSVTSNNLLNPQDDLSFKFEYVHPYVDGVYNPRNRTFRASVFNSRKLSPVFTGGPGMEEVPPIWVDRSGFKANIMENFTRQSKFTYGLVLEEITTRDETSSICTNGARALPSGGLSMDGPPTTLSGTGVDRMAFVQANITRDNTKFVNGAIVGERNVFQLDQGLGIGTNFPFFNRHQLSMTRFIQLKSVQEGAGKPPPPVLVLHGHYGGCVGDLPSYDAFTLGGPYSVRGYNMGELGACRNILELAAELRIPIRNTHVYAFAEHGNDLGSSKEVKGNPTEFFRRAGSGSSYGAGVKLGLVRAEYAVDHNSGTGAIFFRFGERF